MTPQQFEEFIAEMKLQTAALVRVGDLLEALVANSAKTTVDLTRLADMGQPSSPPPGASHQASAPHRQGKKA
mgnify:CR=1 FL=1